MIKTVRQLKFFSEQVFCTLAEEIWKKKKHRFRSFHPKNFEWLWISLVLNFSVTCTGPNSININTYCYSLWYTYLKSTWERLQIFGWTFTPRSRSHVIAYYYIHGPWPYSAGGTSEPHASWSRRKVSEACISRRNANSQPNTIYILSYDLPMLRRLLAVTFA